MFARFYTLIIALVAGAGLLQVCSGLSLSPKCQSAVTEVAAAPEAACIQLSPLLPLLTNGGNTSLVDVSSKWSTGVCSVPACTKDTLFNIVSNVTTGCSAELAAIGWNQPALAWTASLSFLYPTARKLACLKDSAGGRFCLTQTLSNLQDTMALALTLENQVAIKAKLNAALHDPSLVCSDCMKRSVDIMMKSWSIMGAVKNFVTAMKSICGPKFVGSN